MASAEKFAEEVHRRVVKKFPRRKVIVNEIDEIWGLDLASMESLVKYNQGFKFILCAIDVFSKFAWWKKIDASNVGQATSCALAQNLGLAFQRQGSPLETRIADSGYFHTEFVWRCCFRGGLGREPALLRCDG